MDLYEAITYRALGVPDVLSDENQRTAVAVKVYRAAAERSRDPAEGGRRTWADDVTRRPLYLETAGVVVDVLLAHLREHRLDPLLGGYSTDSSEMTLHKGLWDRIFDAEAEKGHGISPDEARSDMLEVALRTIVEWVIEHPNAAHDLA